MWTAAWTNATNEEEEKTIAANYYTHTYKYHNRIIEQI